MFNYRFLYDKLGIILEIIGAVYLLISTLFTRIRMMSLTTDSDNIENAVNSLLTDRSQRSVYYAINMLRVVCGWINNTNIQDYQK